MRKKRMNLDVWLRSLYRVYFQAYLDTLIGHNIDPQNLTFYDFLVHVCNLEQRTNLRKEN